MALVGYMRVSTADQKTDSQSETRWPRPVLRKMHGTCSSIMG